MLSITLVLLALGLSPETGLYVDGQSDKRVLEKAILLEELQARLPGLRVTAVPTQNKGSFYTLEFSLQNSDGPTAKLLFILKDGENQVLLKRSLNSVGSIICVNRTLCENFISFLGSFL